MQVRNLKLFFYSLLLMTVWNLSSCTKETIDLEAAAPKPAIADQFLTSQKGKSINPYDAVDTQLYDILLNHKDQDLDQLFPNLGIAEGNGKLKNIEEKGQELYSKYEGNDFSYNMAELRSLHPQHSGLIDKAEAFHQSVEGILNSTEDINVALDGLNILEADIASAPSYTEVERNIFLGLVALSKGALKYNYKIAYLEVAAGHASHRDECQNVWQRILCATVGIVAFSTTAVVGTIVGLFASEWVFSWVDNTGTSQTVVVNGDSDGGDGLAILTGIIVGAIAGWNSYLWCCRWFADELDCKTPTKINTPFGCNPGNFTAWGGGDAITYLWEVENYGDGDNVNDYTELTTTSSVFLSPTITGATHFNLCVTPTCIDGENLGTICIEHDFADNVEGQTSLGIFGDEEATVYNTSEYFYWGAPNSSGTWSVSSGMGSIQETGTNWARIYWYSQGTTEVTLTVTDDCGYVHDTSSMEVTVNP